MPEIFKVACVATLQGSAHMQINHGRFCFYTEDEVAMVLAEVPYRVCVYSVNPEKEKLCMVRVDLKE